MLKKIYRAAKKKVKKELDHTVRIGRFSPDCIKEGVTHISFDIFDTLIVRDVSRPTDVFRLMEIKTGIKGFAKKRICAEQKAREKTESGEVDIYDIYRSYEELTDSERDSLCALELSTELGLCHALPEMLRFFNACKKRCKVILVSDMYLPSEMMEQILEHCGVTGYDKLYISCEAGCSKGGSGDLYDHVCRDMGISPDHIMHIGNDISSDTLRARQKGLHIMKVRTCPPRLISRVSCPKTCADRQRLQKSMIWNFINNTTRDPGKVYDFYYRFGYENFGVLLWGFCKWLFERMKEDGIEQALFVARDGYMIKKIYDKLYPGQEIPSYYFEMSRRSIRVAASFSQEISYQDILRISPLTSRATIEQIFDAWGLSQEDYTELCEQCGIKSDETFWEKKLETDERIKRLYELLKQDIIENARREQRLMLDYIRQFGLDKKTAFIDIGWGATIQKELLKALRTAGVPSELQGYYIALDKRTSERLGDLPLSAKGYIWDNFNPGGSDDIMEEKAFSGLFETFFLENDGSVKRYCETENGVVAERYPYEYDMPGKIVDETALVRRIQKGAVDFVDTVMKCETGRLKNVSGETAFCFIRDCMVEPSTEMVHRFGEFRFFNSGDQSYLARPKRSLISYGLHPKEAMADFYESQWKTGYFKALFKADISYEKLWRFLKKRFPTAPV